jgi:CHAD domain-containing protein
VPFEESAILGFDASRAEAAQVNAALQAIAAADSPRRRRREGHLVRLPQPKGAPVEIGVVSRQRATLLILREAGRFPLVQERRMSAPAGSADLDWPFMLAGLKVAHAIDDLPAAMTDGVPFATTRTETAFTYEGVAMVCVTHPLVDGRRRIELMADVAHADMLLRFGLRLHEAVGLPIAWPTDETAVSSPIDLDEAETSADAFRAMALSCLHQIVANRAGVVEGAAEGVHQMRVGVRRLRALLSLFAPVFEPIAHAEKKESLSDFQKLVGPMREWDVFIAELLEPLAQQVPEADALDHARDAALAEREVAHAAAAAAVQAPSFAALILDTAAWILAPGSYLPEAEEPIGPFAARILSKQHRKLKRRGREHAEAAPEVLHNVRIQAKKLRYAIEFFGSLHPRKKQKRFLKRVKAVQDALGVVNDAAVAADHVAVLTHRLREANVDPALVGEAAGLIRGWQLAKTGSERTRFAGVWKDYAGLSRFWT